MCREKNSKVLTPFQTLVNAVFILTNPLLNRVQNAKKNTPRPEGPQSVMNHCQPVPFFIEQVVQNKHRPSKESVNRKWHQRSRARLTEDITGDEPRMNNVANADRIEKNERDINLWLSQCRKSFFVCFITCVCVCEIWLKGDPIVGQSSKPVVKGSVFCVWNWWPSAAAAAAESRFFGGTLSHVIWGLSKLIFAKEVKFDTAFG